MLWASCVICIAAASGVVVVMADCGADILTINSDTSLVVCSLREDVSQTRHNIVVKSVLNKKETVLRCAWNGGDCPMCLSLQGFELVGDMTDKVIAKVPTENVQNLTSYKCHVLSDQPKPSTTCQVISVHRQGYLPDHPPSTEIPVSQTTTYELERSTSGPEASTGRAGDRPPREGTNAVCENSTIHILLIISTLFVFILLLRVIIIDICSRFTTEKREKKTGDCLFRMMDNPETVTCNGSGMRQEPGQEEREHEHPLVDSGDCLRV